MAQIQVNGGMDKKADSGHITLHEQVLSRRLKKKRKKKSGILCNNVH